MSHSPTPPLALTTPATMSVDLHGATATATFPVKDSGSKPITVTFTTAQLSKEARSHPAKGWVTQVSPATVHLRPGESARVTLHISAPTGTHAGQYWTNLVATASAAVPGNQQAGAVAHGAVASTLVFSTTGVASPPPPAGPVGHLLVLGFGAATVLCGLAAVAVAVRRRLRHPVTRAQARHAR